MIAECGRVLPDGVLVPVLPKRSCAPAEEDNERVRVEKRFDEPKAGEAAGGCDDRRVFDIGSMAAALFRQPVETLLKLHIFAHVDRRVIATELEENTPP